MELTQKDIDLLGAYWERTLSIESRIELEQRLEENPAFQEAAEQLFALLQALEAAREQKVLNFLKEQDKLSGSQSKRTWIWMALGICLISAVAYFWWRQTAKSAPTKTPPNQIVEFLGSYPSPENTLSLNDPSPTGYAAYDHGQYAEAIPLLEQEFLKSGSTDSLLLFYKGIACLHTNDSAKAVALFSLFTGSATIPQDDNRWFLALAYLQAGNTKAAHTLLQTLISSPARGADAAALEKELKEKGM